MSTYNTIIDLLKRSNSQLIKQIEGQIYSTNDNLEQINITDFKNELIKLLKQWTHSKYVQGIQKLLNIKQIFLNNKAIQFYFQNSTDLFEPKMSELISLLANLESCENNFENRIDHFYNYNYDQDEIKIEKIVINSLLKYNCGLGYSTVKLGMKQLKNLKKSMFTGILIGRIEIFSMSGDNCEGGGSYLRRLDCHNYEAQQLTDLEIDLRDINCDNIVIVHHSIFKTCQNVIKIDLQHSYHINNLAIYQMDYREGDELSLSISSKESSFISLIEIKQTQSTYYDSYQSKVINRLKKDTWGECNQLKNLLTFEQVSEFKYHIAYSKFLLKYVMQVDRDCEKIIYYTKVSTKDKGVIDEFIALRDKMNAIKFQIIAFNKYFSQILQYSPFKTLFDLQEGFIEENIRKQINNEDQVINEDLNLLQDIFGDENNISQESNENEIESLEDSYSSSHGTQVSLENQEVQFKRHYNDYYDLITYYSSDDIFSKEDLDLKKKESSQERDMDAYSQDQRLLDIDFQNSEIDKTIKQILPNKNTSDEDINEDGYQQNHTLNKNKILDSEESLNNDPKPNLMNEQQVKENQDNDLLIKVNLDVDYLTGQYDY